MTKHNLPEHLGWLLKSNSAGLLNPASGQYPQSVTTLELGSVVTSTPVTRGHISTDPTDSVAPNNAAFLATESEFTRPHLPASALNIREKDAMARLQSRPKSHNKPRLLSETIPVSSQSIKPSPNHAPGTSLKDCYTAQYDQRIAGKSIGAYAQSLAKLKHSTDTRHDKSSAGPKKNLMNTALTTSGSKSRNPGSETSALDLTRDYDLHTSSSSTVEAFGESRPIWREDSATRKEPLVSFVTNGKKRKSDELELDELQAEDPSRLSQSSFMAIDMFADEITPPKTKSSPHRPQSGERSKRINTERGPASSLRASSEVFNDDLNSPSTLGKHSGTAKARSPLTFNTLSGQDQLRAPTIRTEPKCKSENRKAVRACAIADSEDEDDEEEYSERQRAVKHEFGDDAHPLVLGCSPIIDRRPQSAIKEQTPEEDDSKMKTFDAHTRQTQLKRTSSGASPFQRDSPTKLPVIPPLSQAATSSAGSNASLKQADKSAVQSFLMSPPDRTQAFLDDLRRALRFAAATVYDRIMQGGDAGDELRQRTGSLSAEISAVDRLLRLREEHLMLSSENKRLKARIISAIERDLPRSTYDQDLVDSKYVLDRLSQIEKKIARLLIEAKLPLFNDTSPSPSNLSASRFLQDNTEERSTTQVKSTQSNLDLKPRIKSEIQLPISSSSMTTHVQQTQAPIATPRSPKKQTSENFAKAQRSPLRTYTSSVATKDVSAYFCPSPPKQRFGREDSQPVPGKNKLTEVEFTKPTPKARGRAIEQDHGLEGDGSLFTTRMGSPDCVEFVEDDYGHDDDDVDMLEVAEELENQHRGPVVHQSNERRDVFTETAGNIMRPVLPKVGPAFAPMPPQASQMQHRWSKDVKTAMKDRFHLRGFRPNQLEAINATLAGKDAFVLMPTGGGKSLCYQLPSIISSGKTLGVTVVISPLLSLMQDQVDHLQRLKIQALLVNSEVTLEHRRLVMGCLRDPDPQKFCQLLYITPEMINKSQAMVSAFRDLYQRGKLARIVIDEAHCVSQWGHDFRPDYKMLGEVRQQFQGVPVIALTATATENVKVDVIYNLGIQNCEVFSQSFNRPNLHYEVRTKGKAKDVLQSIADTINTSYKDQSGIIYCLSKKNCEDIAQKLRRQHNIKAHHYHAGMEPDEKKQVQKQWQAGQYNVIVATIAFGMGIDKPDVRFVIHHTIPKSLEGYYQETGRGGRDGKRSGCYLYYGYQDTSALKRMIDEGEGSWDQKDRQRQMLRNVIQFCENKTDCRRVQVLNYFNETFRREDCGGACDNCTSNSTFDTQDFSDYAVAALDLVRAIQKDSVTLLHCVDVFRGGKSRKISDLQHDGLRQYGVGSDIDRGNVERLFFRLLSEDALSEHNKVNKSGFANQYIHLGKNCNDFTRGRRKLKIQIRTSPTSNIKAPKPKKAAKRAGTGVVGASTDYPASTNISSPIQAAARRRKAQQMQTKNTRDMHMNRDSRSLVDNSDNDDSTDGTEDESDDGFEPLREAGKSRSPTKQRLGPPITIDERIARLNPMHQSIVEGFLITAKKQSDNILINRNLRAHPFTDSMFREMAINFPEDENELLQIPGIEPDKVKRYGKKFLKLIRETQRSYEAIMQQQEDRPQDPNHQNVIDISSDDDYRDEGELDDLEDDDGFHGERSAYFQQAPEVEAFNARFDQIQSQAPPPRARSQSNDSKARRGWKGGRGAFKKSKKASGGSSKGKASAGVTKKQSTNNGTSSNSFGAGPSRSGGGGASGSRGIGMMPI